MYNKEKSQSMKRMMMMMAAVLISASAVAQTDTQDQRPEKKFDKTEMAKHRTDRMVERYSLDDKQAKKLLELNNKYADKMGPHGGRPPHGPKGAPGRPPKDKPEGHRPEPPKDGKHMGPPKDKKQMEETMKAYDAELREILTAEQYKTYQADMQKREADHQKKKE